MLVQKCLLHDEKPRIVKRRFPRQSGVHFVFLSFFFFFLLSRTGRCFLASYMLCFACTGCNALLQASVYFIPNRSHCCTEGIFFLFRVIILREMLMYKSTFCVERYKRQVSRYYSAVDLEIWVLTFLPVYLGKSRDFLSSFKKNLFVCIPVPLC